jgi:hypothetical protein
MGEIHQYTFRKILIALATNDYIFQSPNLGKEVNEITFTNEPLSNVR